MDRDSITLMIAQQCGFSDVIPEWEWVECRLNLDSPPVFRRAVSNKEEYENPGDQAGLF